MNKTQPQGTEIVHFYWKK